MKFNGAITLSKDDDDIIIEDLTGLLIETLEACSYQELPVGVDEETGKILANIFYNAGFELRAAVSFYKSYVPVAVITLIPLSELSPNFPPELVIKLTEEQNQACSELKAEIANLSDTSLDAIKAYKEASDTVEWKLGSIILGRMGMYKGLVDDVIKHGEIKNLKNFSLAYTGNIFNLADYYFKTAGVDSVWAKTIVSCGGAIISAASLTAAVGSTGPLAAIGFFNLVELAGFFPNALECGEHLTHIGGQMWTIAQETYEKSIVVETYSADRQGNNYSDRGDGFIDIFDCLERVNSCRADDLKKDIGEVTEAVNGDVGEWERECHEWGFECNFERANDADDNEPSENIHSKHKSEWGTPTVEKTILP